MNDMKKIGLTALAGSLVATSAYAGDLSVTGSSKITYADADEDEVTGNPFSMSQGITFSGSGDLDNGMTMSWTYTMTNAALSSSNIKVDMGDSGTFAFGKVQVLQVSKNMLITCQQLESKFMMMLTQLTTV